MSEDYSKGFKDGFAAGLEEGKKLAPVISSPGYLGSAGSCHVCGKNFGNGVWGYVCSNQYCPTRTVAYNGGAVSGAVGSMSSYDNMSVGANGPAESTLYDGPEYQNKVWVNGSWAELGN